MDYVIRPLSALRQLTSLGLAHLGVNNSGLKAIRQSILLHPLTQHAFGCDCLLNAVCSERGRLPFVISFLDFISSATN